MNGPQGLSSAGPTSAVSLTAMLTRGACRRDQRVYTRLRRAMATLLRVRYGGVDDASHNKALPAVEAKDFARGSRTSALMVNAMTFSCPGCLPQRSGRRLLA